MDFTSLYEVKTSNHFHTTKSSNYVSNGLWCVDSIAINYTHFIPIRHPPYLTDDGKGNCEMS